MFSKTIPGGRQVCVGKKKQTGRPAGIRYQEIDMDNRGKRMREFPGASDSGNGRKTARCEKRC